MFLEGLTEYIAGAKYARFTNVGDAFGGIIVRHEERQARDAVTREPKKWPDGNDMMEHVITLRQKDGVEVRLVLDSPAKREALREALYKSGAPGFSLGGKLVMKFSGTEPSKGGGFPRKLYEAVYAPPTVSV